VPFLNIFLFGPFPIPSCPDVDREYGQFLAVKLAELRPRLAQQALVTVDNENMDCGQEEGNSPLDYRCREYPLERAFHYLVVEDSYVP
jgi:hypothetical protein